VPETRLCHATVLILVEQTAEAVASLDLRISVVGPAGEWSSGAAWPRLRCGR
jgi:hypothetical protein